MNVQTILPFASTIIMVVFTVSVLQRYVARGRLHFLFWGIGLAMFGAGSFAEAYFAAVGWSAPVFFVWYLFGAALNAGWIGHGTLLLLARRRWVHLLTAALVAGSLVAAFLMLQIMPRLDTASFDPSLPISEQYRSIMPAISDGAAVRLTTPFFNIYGLITLVGGALYSTALFLRKQVLPNRVLGNVLIAAGALSIGLASTATRLGYGQYLYLGELVAAVLMYAGFRAASAPATEAERILAAETAAAG
ncbi:MAG TPA: hypothetical protein VFI11_09740 [Anaerolineales bacterium]|nr:hypothetical protein [Anaerolineales bacterium]